MTLRKLDRPLDICGCVVIKISMSCPDHPETFAQVECGDCGGTGFLHDTPDPDRNEQSPSHRAARRLACDQLSQDIEHLAAQIRRESDRKWFAPMLTTLRNRVAQVRAKM